MNIEEKILENPLSYIQGFISIIDILVAKNEQLLVQLHDHLKDENSILLRPEYETSKHLIDTLLLEEK